MNEPNTTGEVVKKKVTRHRCRSLLGMLSYHTWVQVMVNKQNFVVQAKNKHKLQERGRKHPIEVINMHQT